MSAIWKLLVTSRVDHQEPRCDTMNRIQRLGRVVCAGATVAVLLSGCSMKRTNTGNSGPNAQVNQVAFAAPTRAPATSSLSSPSDGFDTSIAAPRVPEPPTVVDPLKTTPIPPPKSRTLPAPKMSQVLDSWDEFDNPVLRQLQTAALKNATSINDIMSKLREDADLGGSGANPNTDQGPSVYERLLLQRVAEALVDVRLNQQRLSDFYENLAIQQDVAAKARKRKEEGKAGRLDILQMESAIDVTKSKMAPVRDDLRAALKRLAVLTNDSVNNARIRTIASQPQLRLPKMEERIPAMALRRRYDVRQAEKDVVRAGSIDGVYEATILPMLGLEGELTAKTQRESKSSDDGTFGFNLGEGATWSFSESELAAANTAIERSLNEYQTTVFSAASEVESLLTQYHITLGQVAALEQAKENASEATRLALQQYEVDRLDGSHIVSTQARRILTGQTLAEARGRLGQIAILLFLATGAEYDSTKVPATSFYSTHPLR